MIHLVLLFMLTLLFEAQSIECDDNAKLKLPKIYCSTIEKYNKLNRQTLNYICVFDVVTSMLMKDKLVAHHCIKKTDVYTISSTINCDSINSMIHGHTVIIDELVSIGFIDEPKSLIISEPKNLYKLSMMTGCGFHFAVKLSQDITLEQLSNMETIVGVKMATKDLMTKRNERIKIMSTLFADMLGLLNSDKLPGSGMVGTVVGSIIKLAAFNFDLNNLRSYDDRLNFLMYFDSIMNLANYCNVKNGIILSCDIGKFNNEALLTCDCSSLLLHPNFKIMVNNDELMSESRSKDFCRNEKVSRIRFNKGDILKLVDGKKVIELHGDLMKTIEFGRCKFSLSEYDYAR